MRNTPVANLRKRVSLAFLLIGSLLLPRHSPLARQQTTGTVQGNVTDQIGASIPNAQVELTNEGTNVVLKQESNQENWLQVLKMG